MRIIGGKYKGRPIKASKGIEARPTTDYARESLFNILTTRYTVSGADVLDLFSGTGAITYEFISREASSAELVEINRTNYKFITETIRNLRLENIRTYNSDVRTYLKKTSRKFNIVFADPPYNLSWLTSLPELINKSEVLLPGGLLIIEHPSRITFTTAAGYIDTRRYGSVNFSFFLFDEK